MRVAILESIIMPAGHEVEFDRMIINELKRQGHEPVLMVPENFTFKVDYGVEVIYLEGGEVVTYEVHRNGKSRSYLYYANAAAAHGLLPLPRN